MPIPEEFKAFASLFDLDLHDHVPDEKALIAFALKHTSNEQKRVVKVYLDQLLRLNPGGTELQKIWLDAGAGLSIPDHDELSRFLRLVQEEMQ